MNELMNKIDILKQELDNTKEVKDIISINNEIIKDKELLSNIKKYNETHDEKVKEKILSNKLFKEYKDKEIDLNVLILSINKRLKEINNKGKCSL